MLKRSRRPCRTLVTLQPHLWIKMAEIWMDENNSGPQVIATSTTTMSKRIRRMSKVRILRQKREVRSNNLFI